MIKELSLNNYKGFKEEESIKLSSLNFIVGPNNNGKSGLLSSLLLLSQNSFLPIEYFNYDIKWSTPLVDLGSFDDVVYKKNNNLTIKIGISVPYAVDVPFGMEKIDKKDRDKVIKILFHLKKLKNYQNGFLRKIDFIDLTSGEKLSVNRIPSEADRMTINVADNTYIVPSILDNKKGKFLLRGSKRNITERLKKMVLRDKSNLDRKIAGIFRLIEYLNSYNLMFYINSAQKVASGRLGPNRWYPIQETSTNSPFLVQPSVIDRVNPSVLKSEEYETMWGSTKGGTIKFQIKLFENLKKICSLINIDDIEFANYLKMIEVLDDKTKMKSNIIDVGYGISQVIPVIRGCISSARSPLFIEQPEIHLHPKAQGAIGELIVETSKRRQLFVETHSEHLINKARLLIAEGELKPHHVTINYITKDKDGSHSYPIGIDSNGDFTNKWPDGFFDERYQDTLKLLSVNSN